MKFYRDKSIRQILGNAVLLLQIHLFNKVEGRYKANDKMFHAMYCVPSDSTIIIVHRLNFPMLIPDGIGNTA